MSTEQNRSGKMKTSEILVDFIQKNRKILIALLAIIAVGLSAVSGVYVFLDNSEKKAAALVEALYDRYDELRVLTDDAKKETEIEAFLKEIEQTQIIKASSFSAARIRSLAAIVNADRKNWQESLNYWISAAETAPKSYLYHIALYNAATVAEELGDTAKAIELYTKSAENQEDTFPMAPRAWFAIGRLNESRKDFDAAQKAYGKLIESWPTDSWTKLARSRIISIAGNK